MLQKGHALVNGVNLLGFSRSRRKLTRCFMIQQYTAARKLPSFFLFSRVFFIFILRSWGCFFQVVFNPSGDRLAVLDIAGGVSIVETSEDAANASSLGRRYAVYSRQLPTALSSLSIAAKYGSKELKAAHGTLSAKF